MRFFFLKVLQTSEKRTSYCPQIRLFFDAFCRKTFIKFCATRQQPRLRDSDQLLLGTAVASVVAGRRDMAAVAGLRGFTVPRARVRVARVPLADSLPRGLVR